MTIALAALLFLSASMAGAWAIALGSGQSGWIDAVWSFAIGIAGVAAALAPGGGMPARQWEVALLAGLWSLRLGLHIVARSRAGGDDPRYAQLKQEWGARFRARLFWFLQIQALCGLVLVATIRIAAANPGPWPRLADFAGVLVLLASVLGEGVADRQLARFRAGPAAHGRICETGLWGYSRHPNYFFEWLGWCAYAVIAIVPSQPASWVALAGPVMMYWLLVHVSGIPPLEAHMLRSRGALFRDYQARVNAFWPGRAAIKKERSS